jgi:epoxyqueuosine reductase QueG
LTNNDDTYRKFIACPGHALDEEGKTDAFRCLKASQPYGVGGAIRYAERLFEASGEERKEMLRDPMFLSLYQASFMGFQYTCNRCMAVCPAGLK